MPAHIIGELHGRSEPVELAVAINGRVAGVGTTFRNDVWRISMMIDPQYLVDGTNELGLYEIDQSGLLSVTLR